MSNSAMDLLPMLNWTLKVALLFSLAISLVALNPRNPGLRLCLLRSVFVIALALPLAAFVAGDRLALIDPSALAGSAGFTLADQGAPFSPVASGDGSDVIGEGHTSIFPIALMILWPSGALLVIARYLYSARRLHLEFAAGSKPTIQLAKTFDKLRRQNGVKVAGLAVSTSVALPCAFGWRSPRIILPGWMSAFEQCQVEAVLAHELCHVRNRDALWLGLAELVCALYWFNPLVWMSNRRHRHELELVCDAQVIGSGVARTVYFDTIVRAAKALPPTCQPAAAMASGGLIARLDALADHAKKCRPLTRRSRTAVYGLAGALLLMFAHADVIAVGAQPIRAPLLPDAITEAPQLGPVPPDSARMYIRVPAGVTVRADSLGFVCNGMGCVTTVAAGTFVHLTSTVDNGQALSWAGCDSSYDRRSCDIYLSSSSVRVVVNIRV